MKPRSFIASPHSLSSRVPAVVMRMAVLLALALATLAAAPNPANAQAGYREVTIAAVPAATQLSVDDVGFQGPSLGLSTHLGVTDVWSVGVAMHGAWLWPDSPEANDAGDLLDFAAIVGANLDFFEVVPWASLGAGFATSSTLTLQPHTDLPHVALLLRASAGVDYRPARDWSAGVFADWNLLGPSADGAMTRYGIRLTRVFDLDAL